MTLHQEARRNEVFNVKPTSRDIKHLAARIAVKVMVMVFRTLARFIAIGSTGY
jgi:hypothetical protein